MQIMPAPSIQQLHMDSMQHLVMQAMEEEGRDCLFFLAICEVALQPCPPEACGVLMCPLQFLMGNMSLATLLMLPPRAYCQGGIYTCDFPSNYSSGTQALLRNQMVTQFAHPGGMHDIAETSEELPCQKWKQETIERGSARSLCQRIRFNTAGWGGLL